MCISSRTYTDRRHQSHGSGTQMVYYSRKSKHSSLSLQVLDWNPPQGYTNEGCMFTCAFSGLHDRIATLKLGEFDLLSELLVACQSPPERDYSLPLKISNSTPGKVWGNLLSWNVSGEGGDILVFYALLNHPRTKFLSFLCLEDPVWEIQKEPSFSVDI